MSQTVAHFVYLPHQAPLRLIGHEIQRMLTEIRRMRGARRTRFELDRKAELGFKPHIHLGYTTEVDQWPQ